MSIQEKLKSFNGDHPVVLSVSELVTWRKNTSGCRLYLPPIQRSVVWNNEQIVNYWDSLLRAYTPGMMMVHRALRTNRIAGRKGLDVEGHIRDIGEDDYQLFDGQQRMATVLLGMGEGQLKTGKRLWVDLGIEPESESGLKFQLRITTPGQPFGYQPKAPNQRFELSKRQKKWEIWISETGRARGDAFSSVKGDQLIDAECAISFAELCSLLQEKGVEESIANLRQKAGALPTVVDSLVPALDRALQSKVILQQVAEEIVSDQDEYIRFFGRLGQGGTRLSDDELTYSIIKHQHPEIRNRMEAITEGSVGRLADEVDLVLATLRVAKTCAPWVDAKNWEVIGRPSPAFVSVMNREERMARVRELFLSLILAEDTRHGLQGTLEGLRRALTYHSETHPNGLPRVLLARLPRELIDVLILFGIKRGCEQPWSKDDSELLTAFTLHWLLFVGDDGKAAWQAYSQAREATWYWSPESIIALIHALEADGIARYLPREAHITKMQKSLDDAKRQRLRTWEERFSEIDANEEHPAGNALRVLSTNSELIKRALMWLQRAYISQTFPDYDPTSGRDEDLPIDLDHIVPSSVFGFYWRSRESLLKPLLLSDDLALDNFRWQRGVIGNSLGNFRWIDAPTNRSRQDGKYVSLETEEDDLVSAPEEWNSIIPGGSDLRWGENEIGKFQRLIDRRTLQLYERLVTKGGIARLVFSEASSTEGRNQESK